MDYPLKAPVIEILAFAASVSNDQAARNVKPDLWYTQSTILNHYVQANVSHVFAIIFILLLDKIVSWVYLAIKGHKNIVG